MLCERGLSFHVSKSTVRIRTVLLLIREVDSLWTFLDVHGVEPTNNAAEGSLRFPVTYWKWSFGTRQECRDRFIERILSFAKPAVFSQEGLSWFLLTHSERCSIEPHLIFRSYRSMPYEQFSKKEMRWEVFAWTVTDVDLNMVHMPWLVAMKPTLIKM